MHCLKEFIFDSLSISKDGQTMTKDKRATLKFKPHQRDKFSKKAKELGLTHEAYLDRLMSQEHRKVKLTKNRPTPKLHPKYVEPNEQRDLSMENEPNYQNNSLLSDDFLNSLIKLTHLRRELGHYHKFKVKEEDRKAIEELEKRQDELERKNDQILRSEMELKDIPIQPKKERKVESLIH